MNIFKEIKWFFQRGKRGWADYDAWDFHSYFSTMIPSILRQIKEDGYGCPSELYSQKNTNNECQAWHNILEEIAQGFEAAQFLDKHKYHKWVPNKATKGILKGSSTLEIDYEAMENAKKKLDRGMKLFAKYYLNLWD